MPLKANNSLLQFRHFGFLWHMLMPVITTGLQSFNVPSSRSETAKKINKALHQHHSSLQHQEGLDALTEPFKHPVEPRIFKELISNYLKCSYVAILLNEHAMKHVAHRLVVNQSLPQHLQRLDAWRETLLNDVKLEKMRR